MRSFYWMLPSLLILYMKRQISPFPANIYLFKVSNRNIRKRCEICSKLTIKAPKQCHSSCSDVFIVIFEHISHNSFLFILLAWTSKFELGFETFNRPKLLLFNLITHGRLMVSVSHLLQHQLSHSHQLVLM